MSVSLDQYLAHVREAVVVFGKSGLLEHASPAFETYFEATRIGAKYPSIFPGNSLLIEKIAAALIKQERIFLREMALLTSIGSANADVDIFPLSDGNGVLAGVAIAFGGIQGDSVFVEQRKRQDALSRLGQLASGLAHEIKNPLAGIKGAAQLLHSEAEGNVRLEEYAAIIETETDRVDRLVRELLDFTKPRVLSIATVNLNRILHEIVLLQQAATQTKIHWVEEFDPSLPDVSADADALRQVFLNLARNAEEAVGAGGVVRLRTNVVTDMVLKTGDRKQKIVRVTIIDNGSGISQDVLKAVFTPYFSTKSGGTGMGLAVVNRLVEFHGGSVGVKSVPGKGTEFSVYLPA